MESLASYLVVAMLAWVPVHAHAPLETQDHVMTRYESIARDLASVALDESETPLFEGRDGRIETAPTIAPGIDGPIRIWSAGGSFDAPTYIVSNTVGGGSIRVH